MRKPLLTSLFCSAALCAAVSSCGPIPGGLKSSTIFAGGLGDGSLATVLDLGRGLTVSLSSSRRALLALSSRQSLTGPVSIGVDLADALGLTSLKTLALPEVPAGKLDFEQALRRREARLPWRRPGRYSVAAVPSPSPVPVPEVKLGDTASFWVIPRSDSQAASGDRQVQARAAYIGTHCVVMIDSQSGTSLDDRARDMGQVFDSKIYDNDTRLFGMAAGTGEGRVTLLISPAVGDGGYEPTIGYFASRDLFSPIDEPGDDDLAHSNQRAILYISSLVVSSGHPSDYLGTIAHEYQHLINASRKLFGAAQPAPAEDTWLDEGLSMYAMQANGYGLDSDASVLFDHVAGYLAHAPAYSLTEWDLDPEASAYGAVYLFITYLADRFGEGILKELVSAKEAGVPNVRARLVSRGADFDRVFDDWVDANLIDGTGMSVEPRYGYQSLNLMGTYGGRTLRGVTVTTLAVPDTGSVTMLPYSAGYLLLQGRQAGQYKVRVGNLDVSGLVLTPR